VRICCLGDIHYHGSQYDLENLAENIKDSCSDVDAVVVVGDITSSGRLDLLYDVLSAIKISTSVPILIIPGNHDIYLSASEVESMDSLTKLSRFNDLVEGMGCVALMMKPYIIGSVAFVGSIGWYDYSYAPKWLNLSIDAYREKAFGLWVWADRDYVKLPFSDEEFTLHLLNKLEEDIRKVYDRADKVVVVMHHIPFREMVTYKMREEWDYFSAFMGSEAFGHMIRKYKDKVRLVVHGHSHDGVKTRVCREVDGIKVCNCASPIPLILEVEY
jgi:putative phosphoesterase